MNWETYSEKVSEIAKNLQINFPFLKNNIYGFFDKKDILQLCRLVEILNLLFHLFVIFSFGNLSFVLLTWPGDNILDEVIGIIATIIPIIVLILSQIIKRKFCKVLRVMANIDQDIFGQNDLYKIQLMLTFTWINEILTVNIFSLQLNRFIQEKYNKWIYEQMSLEATMILKNYKHKMREGSIIL